MGNNELSHFISSSFVYYLSVAWLIHSSFQIILFVIPWIRLHTGSNCISLCRNSVPVQVRVTYEFHVILVTPHLSLFSHYKKLHGYCACYYKNKPMFCWLLVKWVSVICASIISLAWKMSKENWINKRANENCPYFSISATGSRNKCEETINHMMKQEGSFHDPNPMLLLMTFCAWADCHPRSFHHIL